MDKTPSTCWNTPWYIGRWAVSFSTPEDAYAVRTGPTCSTRRILLDDNCGEHVEKCKVQSR